jgi:hypothetical protein
MKPRHSRDEAAMSDNDWMLWNHEPPTMTQSTRKGEPLFAMTHEQNHYYLECELRYHGEYGVEAQFYLNGDLLIGRRFDLKVQAAGWAQTERDARKREGWSDSAVELSL